jgi:hypothetical protein
MLFSDGGQIYMGNSNTVLKYTFYMYLYPPVFSSMYSTFFNNLLPGSHSVTKKFGTFYTFLATLFLS